MHDTQATILELTRTVGYAPAVGRNYLKPIEDKIHANPTVRTLIVRYLTTQGLPPNELNKARADKLALAYCIPNYLKTWRNRVNPHFALLGGTYADSNASEDDIGAEIGEVRGIAETNLSNAGSSAASSSAASTVASPNTEAWLRNLYAQIESTVGKLVDDKATALLAKKVADVKLTIGPEVKEQIKTLARTAAIAAMEENAKPREISLTLSDAKGTRTENLGLQHFKFQTLLRAASARNSRGSRLNVYLTGPTGSGKTTACENVAKALGLTFEAEGSLDADYKLMGFFNANGTYIETAFFRRYTQGGMILLDEIDNYAPSALLALNAATANDFAQFPHGIFRRHPDTIIIAAANTWGLGATNDYVGRTKLDAASLDRFQPKIDWPIDERLERALAERQDPAVGPLWHKIITLARQAAKNNGIKIIISPRATLSGLALLASDFPVLDVINMTFAAGLSPEQVRQLMTSDVKERATSIDEILNKRAIGADAPATIKATVWESNVL